MTRAAILALASLTWISGCGTVSNFAERRPDEPPAIYGGVVNSCANVAESAHQATLTDDFADVYAGSMGVFYGALLDVPASAIADTVTLPVVLLANRSHKEMKE